MAAVSMYAVSDVHNPSIQMILCTVTMWSEGIVMVVVSDYVVLTAPHQHRRLSSHSQGKLRLSIEAQQ
jgi:hypothetical protein